MKTITWMLALLLMAALVPFGTAAAAGGDGKLYWGEVKTGTYQPLHPNTLNWSGDVLDKGGLDLKTMEITTDTKKADLVMNQYGSIGAASLRKLTGEQLEDPTRRDLSNFGSSYTMAKGDLYLIVLSDGKYAKLRIDRLMPEGGQSFQQVAFSYVMEGAAKEPASASLTFDPPAAPAVSEQKSTIRLAVNKKEATVQGKAVALQVAPTIVDGTTLVPLRFVAEALGSELTWDGGERKITLKQQGTMIVLRVDQTAASVNGKLVWLEVAPTIMADTTMVPIRFISESFNQQVGYDASTKTITITGEAPAAQTAEPSNPASNQGFLVGMMGNWSLSYSVADAANEAIGSLSIFQDGTYLVKLKHRGEFTGNWTIAKESEVEGHPEAIILSHAMDKSDWAVVPGQRGSVQLLQKYVYSNNTLYNTVITTTWLPGYGGVKASDNPGAIEDFKLKEYDFSGFVGSYDLWIEGGATNLYYRDTGTYATHEYQAGAAAGTLTIHADGTYTMKTKEAVSGKWRESKLNEVFGYEYSIILEDGPDSIDWTLLVNGSGKMMVSYEAGKWADGSVMWLPYYIASPAAK
ncbi:copper amine oxidase N-terminal domain-containing protein [Paenibacillus sp. GD4]|uniref:copper amine oxidase N-terminal domain-containing protein n=1 Tax=Paenibacillus sp. GD4 TaxID=3068890 RepID=UPI0027964CE3|nr:copper amine oxidase N-terminal domain-containing protein [Paenibacillus sp. GD4]MDQ1911438.1 copper amine oxidase N-terminal domain-containing protein [Paenibacillus sp. GD4]